MSQQMKFTRDHEWLVPQGDGTYRIGITDYARDALGDLVYLDLPKPGKKLARGADFAVVESVKAASEIYSPLAGEIVAVNDDLAGDLDLLKQDAETGWIVVLKPDAGESLDDLLDTDAYRAFLETLG